MLNLAQTFPQVKSMLAAQVAAQPRSGLHGNVMVVAQAYQTLKGLGWQPSGNFHSAKQHVPLFILEHRDGRAEIWHDLTGAEDWNIDLYPAGCNPNNPTEYNCSADLTTLTAQVKELLSLAPTPNTETPNTKTLDTPYPQHPADTTGADLIAEYDNDFGGRVQRAIDLVKAGQIDFPQYNTTYQEATYHGCRSCQCPDATYRPQYAEFGLACKHTLAQEIVSRIQTTTNHQAYRKLADSWELHRQQTAAQATSQQAWDTANPADDYAVSAQVLPAHRRWQ